jgi:hypothetical protein
MFNLHHYLDKAGWPLKETAQYFSQKNKVEAQRFKKAAKVTQHLVIIA